MKKVNTKELHHIFTNLKKDKKESFSELYEKYSMLVYYIAFSILKNKENSEDIVQIVFTKIYRLDEEKLPENNEASWIYTLTKNEALNYIRKQKNLVDIETIEEISYEDEELKNIIDKDTYIRIIEKLGSKEREIVNLKVLANMKFKDISKLLNIPIGTVQWRYYTALHSLKLLLGNLSLFIIGFMLFIANKNLKKTQTNREGADMSSEEETLGEMGSIYENDESDVQQSIGNEEKNENTSSIQVNPNQDLDNTVNLDNIIDSSTITNQIYENTEANIEIEESTTEVSDNIGKMNTIDIVLLGFSGLFLLLTIIFSVIYIKHQQKTKKKLSK